MSGVTVEPAELNFRFELRRNVSTTLTVTNSTDARVAFKVKTTNPRKYCVRPSNGFVNAHSTRDVQVILQSQREPPASFGAQKDKFLVQAVPLPGSPEEQAAVAEVTSDLFEASSGLPLSQTKLRVSYLEPAQPPSPVPEGIEEPASPGVKAANGTVVAGGASPQRGLDESGAEKAEIRRRLAAVASGETVVAKPATKGFSLLQVVLAVILAYILGFLAAKYAPGL